ncbi:uncharacterized protein LOC143073667 [Mytilus galloprovincialis]|uniref:uncharacterized protein LOC143073667 n=1 Tax=Mytilus galloprovincialis TaxID=29158 RepID=UPI003F7B4AE5
MAYRTLDTLRGFRLENGDVSELDVEINIEEEESILQLLRERPDISGIFREVNVKSDIEEAIHTASTDCTSQVCTSNQRAGEPTCFSCAKKCKLESGHDIKKGMHLVHGRYLPGNKVNDAINRAFSAVSRKVRSEQWFLYEHHAIVSEVLETSDKTATIKVVEFTSLGSLTYGVIESKTPVVIDVETDSHISYRQYGELKYSPDEIVERARSRIGESAYNLMTNNCEHVAVWCVSGVKESFQATDFDDKKSSKILKWIETVLRNITRFQQTDGTRFGSRVAKFKPFALNFIVFTGVFFLLELIFSIFRFVKLRKLKESGFICQACYNRTKIFLIANIVFSIIASIVLSFIPLVSEVYLTVSSIALGIVGTFIFPALFSYLYCKIKTVLNPLYNIPKMMVRKHEHIFPGDVLTIPTDHDIIVKNATLLPRNKASGFVHLEVVHFKFQGLVSHRTIEKECFSFEISNDKLNVFDYPPSVVYSDEEVVQRALEKVGDKNFNAVWYRSSHMSKSCKIPNYLEEYRFSFKKVEAIERTVKMADDVKPGDMINFRYYGLPHFGIVVAKLPPADFVEIEFYHVEGGVVTRCERKFDLDTNKILRHRYDEKDRLPIEETLARAEEKIGEENYQFCVYKSSRLARDCVLKTGK